MEKEKFHFVYILMSEKNENRHYIGQTKNIETRLKAHNSGKVPHTSKFCPWRLKTYIGFSDQEKALEFERYLKSHSGRAFTIKRL